MVAALTHGTRASLLSPTCRFGPQAGRLSPLTLSSRGTREGASPWDGISQVSHASPARMADDQRADLQREVNLWHRRFDWDVARGVRRIT